MNDIRKQANELRKQKNIREALPLYQKLWEAGEANEWDALSYASCLNKMGRSYDALDICRKALQQHPDFENLRSEYARAIFSVEMRLPQVRNEQRFFEAAEKIMELVPPDDYWYQNTLQRVFRHFKEGRVDFNVILDFTERISPETLSREPEEYTDKSGKQHINPSLLEQYYVVRSNALLRTRRPEACIELVTDALQLELDWQQDNDYQLQRTLAKALGYIGQIDYAIELYEMLVGVDKKWFVAIELAKLYHKVGRVEEAIRLAAEAAISPDKHTAKLSVFGTLAKWYDEAGDDRMAMQTASLAVTIAAEERLQIHDDVAQIAPPDAGTPHALPSWKQLRRLQNIWEEMVYGSLVDGTIDNWLPNGLAGFILDEEGNTYFFNGKVNRLRTDRAPAGTPVSFRVLASYDHKKGRPSKHAISIRPRRTE